MPHTCQCSEALFDDGRRFVGLFHSCHEVARRNSFLKEAGARARRDKADNPRINKTAAFSRHMDALCGSTTLFYPQWAQEYQALVVYRESSDPELQKLEQTTL